MSSDAILMEDVNGTAGYGSVVAEFVAATEAVSFEALHGPYLELIPTKPARVLDAGAGVGRDAAVLASMGHEVVAVEPLPQFLAAARTLHDSPGIHWVDDCLPDLKTLGEDVAPFDFVLASGVWHHLDDRERRAAMARIASLVRRGGIFALSLRNGPAGVGTHVFPTDYRGTIVLAAKVGFETMVVSTGEPSLIAGKSDVKWSKLAFKRV